MKEPQEQKKHGGDGRKTITAAPWGGSGDDFAAYGISDSSKTSMAC